MSGNQYIEINSDGEEIIVDLIPIPAREIDPLKLEGDLENLRGMPKSGKPWRKVSKKSSLRNKSAPKMTWEQKMKLKHDKKVLQEEIKQIKQQQQDDLNKHRKYLKDKKKRDEVNKYKTASLQLISDSKKVKKWNKKLRQSLVKLPAEVYENLLKKKGKS